MNGLNKIYFAILLSIGLSMLFAVKRAMQKVNYRAGVFTAVPIYIRNLNFKDSRSDEFGNFYETDPNYFAWKQVNQYFDNTDIDLPDSLHVEYFDYCDSTFYNKVITLNQNQEDWMKFRKSKEEIIYTVGIANKGTLLLWASSPTLGTELLHRELLSSVTPKQKDLYYWKYLSKDKYIEKVYEMLDDSIKNNIRTGFYSKDFRDSTNFILPDYMF